MRLPGSLNETRPLFRHCRPSRATGAPKLAALEAKLSNANVSPSAASHFGALQAFALCCFLSEPIWQPLPARPLLRHCLPTRAAGAPKLAALENQLSASSVGFNLSDLALRFFWSLFSLLFTLSAYLAASAAGTPPLCWATVCHLDGATGALKLVALEIKLPVAIVSP